MKERSLPVLGKGGFRKLAYTEWGAAGSGGRTVVCVHGMTRNSRDFDQLAEALSKDYRVICPDIAGRGNSDWLPEASLYDYPTYLSDMAALIARLDVDELDWIGTSMGGLIGLFLGAMRHSPIRSLVLNDVGAKLSVVALKRISAAIGKRPVFSDFAEAEAYFRTVYAAFGALTDQQWKHLTEHSLRETKGGFEFHYDPKIADAFGTPPDADIDLWPVWNALKCPVLAIRGEESDLLQKTTLEAMKTSFPDRCETVEIPGCGHAPALMDVGQISLIRDWLAAR